MPSHARTREEERRLSIRTLAIASLASATAAVLTSQFWAGGTPIAAAVTPVIVALVSEMLHRPSERIARAIPAVRGPDREGEAEAHAQHPGAGRDPAGLDQRVPAAVAAHPGGQRR